MLVAGGYGPLEAAAVISLASWVMIVSGAVCGLIADRTGKSDAILYACLVVAMLSLALLPQTRFAIPLTLAFGLMGMAPAGLIMALTGHAMAPEHRAFGMGIFFSIFFSCSPHPRPPLPAGSTTEAAIRTGRSCSPSRCSG